MPAPFKRETSLGWLVNVVARSMSQDLDKLLKADGLSLKVWPTLMCLWEQEGVTQAELASLAQIPEYTTTRVLDSLEASDVIERRTNPNNRRAHTIHLTKKGRRLQKRLVPHAVSVNERHLGSLNRAEASELVRLLTKIADKVSP